MSVSRLTIAKIENDFLKLNNPKKKNYDQGIPLVVVFFFIEKKAPQPFGCGALSIPIS